MAVNFTKDKREAIVCFLRDNRGLNNKQCSDQLMIQKCIKVSERTVFDYRKENGLEYQRPKPAYDQIMVLEKQGHKITGKLLVEKLAISQRYAYDLANEWRAKKTKPPVQKPQFKLKQNQRLTAHGILTVTGAVTRH